MTIRNLQGPFKRKRFDSRIKLFKHFPWKVIAIVEFRKILDEFGARHFSTDILTVEIGIEQHDSAR